MIVTKAFADALQADLAGLCVDTFCKSFGLSLPALPPWLVKAAHDVAAQPRDDQGRWVPTHEAAVGAMTAAHPHPGPLPPHMPGAGNPRMRAESPALQSSYDAHQAHAAAFQRYHVAQLVRAMLAEPHKLVEPKEGQRKGRAVRAVEDAVEAATDRMTLLHGGFAGHREAVAGSHEAGGAAIQAAAAEADRRAHAAVANAERHLRMLVGDDRKKAAGMLDKARALLDSPLTGDRPLKAAPPWVVKAAHDVSDEARDERGRWTVAAHAKHVFETAAHEGTTADHVEHVGERLRAASKAELEEAASAMGFAGAKGMSRPKLAESLHQRITLRRGMRQRVDIADRDIKATPRGDSGKAPKRFKPVAAPRPPEMDAPKAPRPEPARKKAPEPGSFAHKIRAVYHGAANATDEHIEAARFALSSASHEDLIAAADAIDYVIEPGMGPKKLAQELIDRIVTRRGMAQRVRIADRLPGETLKGFAELLAVPALPPWVVKSRDAGGREHASDGRFGTTSGSHGSKAKPRGASDRHSKPTERPARNPDDKAAGLAERIGEVPKAIRTKVTSFIQARHRKLSQRYGPKGALAILGATVMLLPAPIPGTSLIPVAVAEVVLRLRRALATKGHERPLDEATIQREARRLLRSLYAHCGLKFPPAPASRQGRE